LPEKDDMRTPEWCSTKLVVVPANDRCANVLRRKELRLRCVSSGGPAGGCSCPRTISANTVVAAWARELEKDPGERFFHFAWDGGEWLAYGLADGLVRGVYCPDHSADRDERSPGRGSRASVSGPEFAVGA
jgi:hypothetical protein